MRQLVQLHDSMPVFDALDTDVIAVALEENDPAKLARVPKLVGRHITYLANAEGRADGELPATSALLVDKQGVVRTVLPGIVQARAPTRLIIEELAKMTGKSVPSRDQLSDDPDAGPIQVRWAWSHDSVGPNDPLKLIFLPELGDGVNLAASGEKKLTVSAELPPGLELVKNFTLPKGKPGEGVQGAELVHRFDVPLGALELRGTKELDDGEAVVKITLTSSLCSRRGCHDPEPEVYEIPIRTTSKQGERGQLYAWPSW